MSYTKSELLNYWDKNGFECLEDINNLRKITFVPFVGAGMSVPFGYRTWNEFLKKVITSLTEKKNRTEVHNTLLKGEYGFNLQIYINSYISGDAVKDNGIDSDDFYACQARLLEIQEYVSSVQYQPKT